MSSPTSHERARAAMLLFADRIFVALPAAAYGTTFGDGYIVVCRIDESGSAAVVAHPARAYLAECSPERRARVEAERVSGQLLVAVEWARGFAVASVDLVQLEFWRRDILNNPMHDQLVSAFGGLYFDCPGPPSGECFPVSPMIRSVAAMVTARALEPRLSADDAHTAGHLLAAHWSDLRVQLVASMHSERVTLAEVCSRVGADEDAVRSTWRGLRAVSITFCGREHRAFRRGEELFYFRSTREHGRFALIVDSCDRPRAWRAPTRDPDGLDPGTHPVIAERFVVGTEADAPAPAPVPRWAPRLIQGGRQ